MDVATVERAFFRKLNPLIEPWARMGCVSPVPWPMGVILLETTGRRSGLTRSVPVLAMLIDDHVVVGTTRGDRSEWFRNLQVTAEVRYWLGGEPHEARALTFAPGREGPPVGELPPIVQHALAALFPSATTFGCRFAVLAPEKEKT